MIIVKERLKKLIKTRNITQKELSDVSGIA